MDPPHHTRRCLRFVGLFALLTAGILSARKRGEEPDVKTIIQRSVAASEKDFQAAPQYNYKERDRTGSETKTNAVTILEGSPYERLIAINGEDLPAAQAAEELKKQQHAEAERRAESSDQRKRRIAKYERERARDHEMMSQLSEAFDFKLAGKGKVRGFNVWNLKATPRPGYRPPNMQSQVLRGMQGELWIDCASYRWVKVSANVIRPVSIVGFLARVEPGTQFEVEKSPVDKDIWQVTHFVMKSRAKVLFLVRRNASEDVSFYDFERVQSK